MDKHFEVKCGDLLGGWRAGTRETCVLTNIPLTFSFVFVRYTLILVNCDSAIMCGGGSDEC